MKTYKDARGREVPAAYVPAYDKAKDAAAQAIYESWKKEEAALARLWRQTTARIGKIRELAARRDRVALGKKGNFSFRSFDGKIEIRHDFARNVMFDERLSLAKELIDKAVEEMSETADSDLRELAAAAFRPRGKNRQLDRSRLHDICRMNIRNANWMKAVELIKAAEVENGRREYLRVSCDGIAVILDIQRNGSHWDARNGEEEGGAE